jgi:hypothetical protein
VDEPSDTRDVLRAGFVELVGVLHADALAGVIADRTHDHMRKLLGNRTNWQPADGLEVADVISTADLTACIKLALRDLDTDKEYAQRVVDAVFPEGARHD